MRSTPTSARDARSWRSGCAPTSGQARSTMALIVRGGRVLTGPPPALTRADVLVEADRITAVGPALAAPAGAQAIDAGGHIVLPGLINAHTHAGAHLARG